MREPTVYTIGYGVTAMSGMPDGQDLQRVGDDKRRDRGDREAQPCQSLEAMASAQVNFYSDDGERLPSDGAHRTRTSRKLTAIFRAITDNMSVSATDPQQFKLTGCGGGPRPTRGDPRGEKGAGSKPAPFYFYRMAYK